MRPGPLPQVIALAALSLAITASVSARPVARDSHAASHAATRSDARAASPDTRAAGPAVRAASRATSPVSRVTAPVRPQDRIPSPSRVTVHPAPARIPSLSAAAALEASLSPSAPAERDFADPSTWGPYGVGVRMLEVPARDHPGETLHTLIWYPADVPAGSSPYIYTEAFGSPLGGVAVQDAPVWADRDPYPAIAFSHGNGGVSYQSIFLTEHLASHGYVVISCDHPGNTLFDYHPQTFITGLFSRPRDISALLDELQRIDLEPNSWIAGQIDLDRIGMTGHSLGGYTTLAVAGAQLNLNAPAQKCAATHDPEACLFTETARQYAQRDALEGKPGALRDGPGSQASALRDGLRDLSDKRVKAAAPLAPWGWEPFREAGLSSLHLPLQVHGGGLDDTCPMEVEIQPVYDYAQSPKSMLEIFGAGHYTYSDYCQAYPDFDECFPPFIDIDYAHQLINTWVTSHFKLFLDGDTRYQPYLEADYAAGFSDDVAWSDSLGL